MLLAIAACTDGGDAEPPVDAARGDARQPDAATDEPDAGMGEPDAAAPPDATTPVDATTMLPVRSEGCGRTPPRGMRGGTVRVTDFPSGGRERVYVVTIPAGYDPDRAYALTLGLHPGGGRAQPRYDLDETMAGESINVYPQSLDESGVWDKTGDDDIPYLDDLVAFFEARFCVDRSRVFAGGFSQGARMAAVLGCIRGDVYRAVAALSPGPPGGTTGDVTIEQCVGQAAYFHITGLEDTERYGLLAYYVPLFRTLNHCSEETVTYMPTSCVRYTGCDAGKRVVQCEPPGLGHMDWKPGGQNPFGRWFLRFASEG